VTPEERDTYVKLGRQIQVARQAAGLTQTAVAKHLGLGRVSVANIEAGRQGMTVHGLLKLHGLLGIEFPGLAPVVRHDDVVKHAQLAAENEELRRRLRLIREIVENRGDPQGL
jgi:transcriptional regulator with XRE-family HTH domain